MIVSVLNLQDAYAKALVVDRGALAEAQRRGDVLGGHRVLLEAFSTDVRPLTGKVRVALGGAEDPVRALHEGGYLERIAAERGSQTSVVGGWGR
jgi:L-rhamnose isomerase/sugar isomerase